MRFVSPLFVRAKEVAFAVLGLDLISPTNSLSKNILIISVSCNFLQWWRVRCLEWRHDHVEDGKFADQKFLDQSPALFGSVAVLAHPRANLAAWNLTGVKLRRVDDTVTVSGWPLIFYHFHQLKRINPRCTR